MTSCFKKPFKIIESIPFKKRCKESSLEQLCSQALALVLSLAKIIGTIMAKSVLVCHRPLDFGDLEIKDFEGVPRF